MNRLLKLLRLLLTRLETFRLTGRFRIRPSPLPTTEAELAELERLLETLRKHNRSNRNH